MSEGMRPGQAAFVLAVLLPLQALAAEGRFPPGSRVLLMHLGGTPAIHAYASQFGSPQLMPYR